MQNSRPPYKLLLSFDLEEFDIPDEYGSPVPVEEQLAITKAGLSRLLPVLEELSIPATFFTTAFFAQQNVSLVKQIALKHEIASHAFYHSRFSASDILNSRLVLEDIIGGNAVTGFRMPRLAPVDRKLIKDAGYTYDASLNPTWLPGRYNNINKPRTLFMQDQLYILPSSVTPNFRLPLFWLSFKNMPLFLIKQWSRQVLKKDHYLCLYLHPWEFADLEKFHSLPFYTRKPSGRKLLDKLSVYLLWLQSLGCFTTMHTHIKNNMPEVPAGAVF